VDTDLRPKGLLVKLLEALISRLHRHEPCAEHCRCVVVLRREMGLLMAIFVVVVGALIRREILSYVPPVLSAPPPPRSGEVLPGLDGKR
jgi:hypothetical protein